MRCMACSVFSAISISGVGVINGAIQYPTKKGGVCLWVDIEFDVLRSI